MIKFIYLSVILSLLFVLSGCQSLLLNKSEQSEIISKNRTNISTSNKVSLNTASILLSAGLTQKQCMANFHDCLMEVNGLFLTDDDNVDKNKLALLSELYYAYADHLIKQDDCKYTDREPIHSNYKNTLNNTYETHLKNNTKYICLNHHKYALIKTLNYSYGYLFYDQLTGKNTKSDFVQENDIKTQDLYHLAINSLIYEIYKQKDTDYVTAIKSQNWDVKNQNPYGQLQVSRYQIPENTINLYLENDAFLLDKLQQQENSLSDLISAYDKRMKSLQTTSTRQGIGVGYVGVLENRYVLNVKNHTPVYDYDDLKSRIHSMGNILLTAVAIPFGQNLNDVLNSHQTNIYLFNPYQHQYIDILGKNYPLAANFSAGYSQWLDENHLSQAGITNMLKKQDMMLPELFMLEPYNPNKKVVIMVHGLASSPATWLNLTNNLLADPVLRQHYQVWQIFYATNLPMLENRYQIQSLIEAAYHFSDPDGKNPASKNSVLIGHSMGGVISRMMVSNDNLLGKLDTLNISSNSTNNNHPSQTTIEQAQKLLKQNYHIELNNRFVLQSLPQVDTAVFISSPFRGTDYAERWFTLLARRIIRLPISLTKNIVAMAGSDDEKTLKHDNFAALYLQNGASQLSDRSAFMQLTANIEIDKNVHYYNIMGNHAKKSSNPTNQDINSLTTLEKMRMTNLSDGIVPYKSSHLDGAVREIILKGNHSLHENPQTVKELRKILHEHLNNLGETNSN